jgi:hypothetical protein
VKSVDALSGISSQSFDAEPMTYLNQSPMAATNHVNLNTTLRAD